MRQVVWLLGGRRSGSLDHGHAVLEAFSAGLLHVDVDGPVAGRLGEAPAGRRSAADAFEPGAERTPPWRRIGLLKRLQILRRPRTVSERCRRPCRRRIRWRRGAALDSGRGSRLARFRRRSRNTCRAALGPRGTSLHGKAAAALAERIADGKDNDHGRTPLELFQEHLGGAPITDVDHGADRSDRRTSGANTGARQAMAGEQSPAAGSQRCRPRSWRHANFQAA